MSQILKIWLSVSSGAIKLLVFLSNDIIVIAYCHCVCAVQGRCLRGCRKKDAWSQRRNQGLLFSSHDHRIFQNACSPKDCVQEIFAVRKMSRTLEIVTETGFEPKKSPSGVISYVNMVFLIFHVRNLISEYKKLL